MGRAFLVPGSDFSNNNLGTVTPKSAIAVNGIAIIGPAIVSAESEQYSASFTPEWATQREVTWSIVSGGEYATITSGGLLVVTEGTLSQDVVIRCTSSSNNSVYAEKTVNVTYTEAPFVQTDYLQNTGASYLFLNDFTASETYGATIESRGIITNGNGYLLAYRQDYNNTSARFAHYRQNAGNMGCLLGTSDFKGTGIAADSSIFRYVFTLSSSSSSKTASLKVYKRTSTTASYTISSGSYICYMSGSLSIFGFGTTPHGGPNKVNEQNIAIGKFYGASITNGGNTIANYVPGTIEGVPCIKNTVTGQYFFDATNNGDLVAGNDE